MLGVLSEPPEFRVRGPRLRMLGALVVVIIALGSCGSDLTEESTSTADPNSTDNATPVEIGEATQGALDYNGDIDFFAFQADEGQYYEIDVTLGTLQDSALDLFAADGTWLDRNDDDYFGDSRGSRLIWQAPNTATYYIQVISSWVGTGTYILTIT